MIKMKKKDEVVKGKFNILSKKLEARARRTIGAIRYIMLEEYRSKGEKEIRKVKETYQSLLKELNALTEEELTNLLIMADWFGHSMKERMDAIEFIKNRESTALRSLAAAIADSNMQGYFLKRPVLFGTALRGTIDGGTIVLFGKKREMKSSKKDVSVRGVDRLKICMCII